MLQHFVEPARLNPYRRLHAVVLVDPAELILAAGDRGLVEFHAGIADDPTARDDPRERVVLRRAVLNNMIRAHTEGRGAFA